MMSLLKLFCLLCVLAFSTTIYGKEASKPFCQLQAKFDLESKSIEGLLSLPSDKKLADNQPVGLHILSFDKEKNLVQFKFILPSSESKNYYFDKNQIALLGPWHPMLETKCEYWLSLMLPQGFSAITQGAFLKKKTEKHYSLHQGRSEIETSFVVIVAGNYTISEKKMDKIIIRTYFFDDDKKLAETYIDKAESYIKEYSNSLTPFPFKNFSIVENKLQTGYSFTSFTLLGDRVLRLPFIVNTSLRHEVLHQWFGSAISLKGKQNWLEALTSYMADAHNAETNGDGVQYRKRSVLGYLNKVTGNKTLADFYKPEGKMMRAIGYNKGAMFFHQLEKMVGEREFLQLLKTFVEEYSNKEAGWMDLKSIFSSNLNKVLSTEEINLFFSQWLHRSDLIDFEIRHRKMFYRNGDYIIKFDIIQKNKPYIFKLPIAVYGQESNGAMYNEYNYLIKKKKTPIEIKLKSRPSKIVFDQDYDLFRKLHKTEIALTINSIPFNSNTKVIVAREYAKQKVVVDYFSSFSMKVIADSDVKFIDLQKNNLILLMHKNTVAQRIFALNADDKVTNNETIFQMRKNPFSKKKKILLVEGNNIPLLFKVIHKIRHYGSYSKLRFINGKNVEKKIHPTDTGIVINLDSIEKMYRVPEKSNFDKLINKLEDKKIICIGENHDQFSNHQVQLRIIEQLYKKNKDLAIGLEMFQQPYQRYLDDYITGEISEKEMLIKTEYFSRWGFNYNLYRGILHFAKKNHIPLVALNLEREVTKQISAKGLFALSSSASASLPSQLDLSNVKYRKSIKRILSHHMGRTLNDFKFENFFAAQVAWDETMASNAFSFIKSNPQKTMIIIVGNGHLSYKHGIPSRLQRLSSVKPFVILNNPNENAEPGLADYIIESKSISAEKSLKLGLAFVPFKKTMQIKKVMKNSLAEKSGFFVGDKIIKINSKKVFSLATLHELLYFAKQGDTITITVERRVLWFFKKQVQLMVRFH